MSMTVVGAKIAIEGVIAKTEKSIEREVAYLKELADDKAAYSHIEQIEKEIKISQNSLDRIEVEKAELMAFNYFMQNAPDEPEA